MVFAGALNRQMQPNVKHIHAEKTHIEKRLLPSRSDSFQIDL